MSILTCPKASRSRPPIRPRSRSAASTSRRSGSSRPKSAVGASPNPIRARASAIAASLSSARKERRSKMAKLSLFERRRRRVRTAIRSRAGDRPRLTVHRTGQHIYAQVIDDAQGRTLASASSLGSEGSGANVDAAVKVGKDIAAAAKKAGVTAVVFDRGGFLFPGRVKALADAAREGGREF